ncbi:hypothetical protein HHI36_006695 [Cryptolaemus montrouzieri]|uniref:Uncharacterized protein n=1 Tax=Cryptolaemus montrouzieri TaxID=559131 RepID=A0ABD2NYV7_9CUCU
MIHFSSCFMSTKLFNNNFFPYLHYLINVTLLLASSFKVLNKSQMVIISIRMLLSHWHSVIFTPSPQTVLACSLQEFQVNVHRKEKRDELNQSAFRYDCAKI